jgi:hypothetical protein
VHKKVLGLFYFTVTIAILVGVLMVTNWLPTVLQEGAMKRYSSIEEVKSKLGIKDIYVPTYVPQSIAWPPSKILAQSRPFTAVLMEFTHGKTGDVDLVISQVADRGSLPEKKIALVQIREKTNYPLKGRTALLEVGLCKNDALCSRISWHEGNYTITAAMKAAPFELLKIADSMLR